jgi:hypothetical protein
MSCKRLLPMTAVLVMLVIRVPMAPAQEAATGVPVSAKSPVISIYAEGLYKEYAAGAAGKISFSLETVENGRTAQLAGTLLSSLVTVPPFRILSEQYGRELNNLRFVLPEDSSDGQQDMNKTVDQIAGDGFPLTDGLYRRLLVTDTIGGDVRFHESIEFCWPELDHCVVLDPVLVFPQ